MLDAIVETTTTYKLTTKQLEDLILQAAGVVNGPGVSIRFDVHGSYEDDDGYYQLAGLDGAVLTITKKEKKQ